MSRSASLFPILGALMPTLTLLLTPVAADAQITRMVITERDSPTFEGHVFGDVGTYEWLIGYAEGELDPADPRNAGIVNLDRAPRNQRGRVEYRVDVQILKPVDLARGSGRIFYDVLNRGGKRSMGHRINGGPNTNDPRVASEMGSGFLMNQGYTMVWNGWQADVRTFATARWSPPTTPGRSSWRSPDSGTSGSPNRPACSTIALCLPKRARLIPSSWERRTLMATTLPASGTRSWRYQLPPTRDGTSDGPASPRTPSAVPPVRMCPSRRLRRNGGSRGTSASRSRGATGIRRATWSASAKRRSAWSNNGSSFPTDAARIVEEARLN